MRTKSTSTDRWRRAALCGVVWLACVCAACGFDREDGAGDDGEADDGTVTGDRPAICEDYLQDYCGCYGYGDARCANERELIDADIKANGYDSAKARCARVRPEFACETAR